MPVYSMPELPDESIAGPLITKRAKRSTTERSLVKVAVRLRPAKTGEGREVVSVNMQNEVHVEDPRQPLPGTIQGWCRTGAFAVDHAYGPSTATTELYQDTVQRLVKTVVRDGTNACCFAYGATGSGKTFTMEGTDTSPGVMQLGVRDLFAWRSKDSKVSIGYFQIYNEAVTDLLTEDGAPELAVRMDGEGRAQVCGLHEAVVESEAELLELVASGAAKRATNSTAVNETSSRSHAILQIYLTQPTLGLTSKLSLIDLAGSERAGRANTNGERLLEARNINHSLLALSKCIRARVQGNKPNYRESKLTRLLEDSLSGVAATTMICACSPAAAVFDETLQTLSRANEVKMIKRPVTAPPPPRPTGAPPPPPPPVSLTAVAEKPQPSSAPSAALPMPLKGLNRVQQHRRRASEDSVGGGSAISSSSSAASEAGNASPTGDESTTSKAVVEKARREAEMSSLLTRLQNVDTARFQIFLRASNALLDGLEESGALKRRSNTHMKHKQLKPMIAPPHILATREAADSAPATTVSSPLAENAPASNPIAGSLGLLRRAIHSNSATSIGGRGRSRPTTPPPGGFGASLPHSNNNNNNNLPPLYLPSSREPSRIPTPPSQRSSQHSSKHSSRAASRSASPRGAKGVVSGIPRPSVDGGATVYRDVGYRSPPNADEEVVCVA